MMKCLTLIVAAGVVLGLAAGEASASVSFTQTTDNGSGQYEWIADNWSLPWVPTTDDEARLGTVGQDLHCHINGQDAVCRKLLHGYGAGLGAQLTINSGTLTIDDPGANNAFPIGWTQDAAMHVNGGTVIVKSTSANGLVLGRDGDGVVNQSSGLVDVAAGGISLASKNPAYGTYDISGGTVTFGKQINVRISSSLGENGSLLKISGSASVLGPGTGYGAGLQLYDGGTVQIIGGNATINIAKTVEYKPANALDTDGTFETISFEVDATGASTVVTNLLKVATSGPGQTNYLELLANGAAVDTYTLFHTNLDPTAGVGNLTVTGDGGFGAPYVVDLTGSTGGYDVRVGYVPEPATLALLAIGGVGLLIRKRR